MRVLTSLVAVIFFILGVIMPCGAGEPRLNPNLIPMFAGVEKTETQIATDKKPDVSKRSGVENGSAR